MKINWCVEPCTLYNDKKQKFLLGGDIAGFRAGHATVEMFDLTKF